MLRLTPVRLLYLIIGAVIGAAVFFVYVSVAGTPAFLTSLVPAPRATTQAPSKTAPTFAFGGQTLVKVVSVNQNASKGGVEVRINALEEYGDGFSLTYDIMGGQPGEPAPVLEPERFSVIDDHGGSYQLSSVGSSATVGPGLSSGYLAFTPALSQQATTLTVTVPHLLVLSDLGENGAPQVIDGPWQIQVPVR
ncbi:MAG: hypothetical protein ACRDIY_05605 [Chloroflexota bacterium]